MNKNISVWLIIPQTNLHVGNESVVNFSVIDKAVQRDVVTDIPCINSSSLKGALKEYLDQETDMKKDTIKELFGSVKKDGNDKSDKNDDTQKGSAVFFDANLLFIPERCIDGKSVYQLVYSDEVIDDFMKRVHALGATCDKAELTKDKVKVKKEEFKELCSDDALPIIARNCLDNGESVNLWYEQVLPSRSVFATMIMTPNGELDEALNGKIVQIGAHATIGYGYCKMVKL